MGGSPSAHSSAWEPQWGFGAAGCWEVGTQGARSKESSAARTQERDVRSLATDGGCAREGARAASTVADTFFFIFIFIFSLRGKAFVDIDSTFSVGTGS